MARAALKKSEVNLEVPFHGLLSLEEILSVELQGSCPCCSGRREKQWQLFAHLPLSPLELQVHTTFAFPKGFFAEGFLNTAVGFATVGFYFCLRRCLIVGSVIYQSPCQVHCSRSRHIKSRAWIGMLQSPAKHRGHCMVFILQSCLLRPCSDLLSHKCHCRRSRTSHSSCGSLVALTLCCSLSNMS